MALGVPAAGGPGLPHRGRRRLRGAEAGAEKCRDLLRGGETTALRRDPKQAALRSRSRAAPAAVPDDADPALFEALRTHRKTLADEQGVPLYVIFHDRTLHEMSPLAPRSLDGMAGISGVGEKKLERYGEGFLRVIAEHLGTAPPEEAETHHSGPGH